MSDEQMPAWARAMEEQLIGKLEASEGRVTGAILKLIAESEERLTRRIERMFKGDPKPPEAA